jgi:hypothetical protein
LPYHFTPVVLDQPPAGYELLYAHNENIGSPAAMSFGLVRYRPISGNGPYLDIILRPSPGFGDLDASARQQWDIGGRVVVDDNPVPGCQSDACSIGLQWDAHTNLSLMWTNEEGQALTLDQGLDSLLQIVPQLVYDPTVFVEGPLTP